ncbi:hypothetical protein [Clavibacter michiganensis]|uniref:hypothetical protein n=1 Tax=Clavibacter michiganensis TaxID=28447 RepID=UPI00293068DE|nr:hypothetical protein [Clavibacter michiganensis]
MSAPGSTPLRRLLYWLRTVSADPQREYRRRLARLAIAAAGYAFMLWIMSHAVASLRPFWYCYLVLTVLFMAGRVNDVRRARAVAMNDSRARRDK